MSRLKLFGSAATLSLMLAASLAACQPATSAAGTPASEATQVAEAAPQVSADPELGSFGIDPDPFDQSVAPGDDFFRYVNGSWLDTFEIPSDFTNYGSFTILFERSRDQVREIIEDARQQSAARGTLTQKIADYYNAYQDTDTINALGLAPAEADLARIAGAETHDDIVRLMSDPALSLPGPFVGYIYVDAKQTDRYLVHFSQSGLGLPNRDFYLEDGFTDKTDAYVAYIAQILDLSGTEDAAAKADTIYALEKRMAEIHWPQQKQRDPNLTYNLVTREELDTLGAGINWNGALETAGLSGQTEFIINEPDALTALSALFAETPVSVWKDYLRFHYLSQFSDVLPSEFDTAHYEFYGRTLSGQAEKSERWKLSVHAVNSALGEAVGELYVERHFPPESKAMMEDLIANIKLAMAERIDQLDWMSDDTKAEAKEKLSKFRAYIGYPDEWRDFSDLTVEPNDALGNNRRANVSFWKTQVQRLSGGVQPGKEWGMLPHTVNAYYSPPRNAIYFPAAILQPPFFDPAADPAVNYGGIGAVIGHEIGHGFDDQGRKQDGDGVLRDWWTAEDTTRFEERTARLGAQFATYSPIDGYFINPELTMGENVGDLGGLSIAYYAYKLSLGGEEAPVIDGYSGDQRFFLSWGQVWRRKYRDEELTQRMFTDPHSPSEFRVNGIVRNMDPWYDAFGISAGDALYLPPEERVSIW